VSQDRSPPLKAPSLKVDAAAPFVARLWQYQSERFPLANHGVMTLVFALAACSFAASLRFEPDWPAWRAIALAVVAGLAQFVLLRIADEHKDFATDSAHRPYRPVPRGLISLAELRIVGVFAAAIMVAAVAFAQSTTLALLMLIVWAYFALMSAEFFVGEWLQRHPVLYLFSHMIITPLIAWLMAGFQLAHDGLALSALPRLAFMFLISVLFLGVVLELGRKIRATADEENGVETYSALWGPLAARNAWLGFAFAAAAATVATIAQISGSVTVALLVVALGLTIMLLSARRFTPSQPGSGKQIEKASGAFALAVLLTLGVAPHVTVLP
jgi:hypothetical protein